MGAASATCCADKVGEEGAKMEAAGEAPAINDATNEFGISADAKVNAVQATEDGPGDAVDEPAVDQPIAVSALAASPRSMEDANPGGTPAEVKDTADSPKLDGGAATDATEEVPSVVTEGVAEATASTLRAEADEEDVAAPEASVKEEPDPEQAKAAPNAEAKDKSDSTKSGKGDSKKKSSDQKKKGEPVTKKESLKADEAARKKDEDVKKKQVDEEEKPMTDVKKKKKPEAAKPSKKEDKAPEAAKTEDKPKAEAPTEEKPSGETSGVLSKPEIKEREAAFKKLPDADRKKQSEEMIKAAKGGDLHSVTKLLAGGCSVHCPDGDGWTPLMKAAEANKPDIIELLFNYGADSSMSVSLGEWGNTALHHACRNNHKDAVKVLLTRGNKKDLAAKNHIGKTPKDYTQDEDIRRMCKKAAKA